MYPRPRRPFLAALLLLAGPLPGNGAEKPGRDAHGDPLPAHAVARVGTVRFRHGDTVRALAFAPDGKTLASASDDHTVSLWDAASGQELVRFSGHAGPVLAVAFTADGKTLASCGADRSVRLWDTTRREGAAPAAGKELRRFTVEAPRIDAAAFGPGGKALAVAGGDRAVVLHDVRAGTPLHRMRLDAYAGCLAFSADGKTLAAGRGSNGLTLWDATGGRPVGALGKERLLCVAFSPRGGTIATGDYDLDLRLWSVPGGRLARALAGHRFERNERVNGVFCVAFAPDGKTLASGGSDGSVRLWDAGTGKELARCDGHGRRVTALAFAPDGKALASGGQDNTVRLWSVPAGKALRPVPGAGGPLAHLAAAPDGKTLATVSTSGRLAFWDPAPRGEGNAGVPLRPTARERHPLADAPADVGVLAFAPDGKTLTVATLQGRFRLLEWPTGKERAGWRGVGPLGRLTYSPDGKVLAAGSRFRLTLSDPAGNLRRTDGVGRDHSAALAFTPDGRKVVSGGSAAAVGVWDVATGEELPGFEAHRGGVLAATFSPDGRVLASAGRDNMIRLWEVASRKARRNFGADPDPAQSLVFTPDGRFLASGHSAGAVRLWDVGRGRLVAELPGHRGAVTAVLFLRGGKTLVSSAHDGTALVWDVADLLREGRVQTVKLSDAELQALWDRLADADVPAASVALQTLTLAPAQAVPLLRDRVKPVSAERIAGWLRNLDSDTFTVRNRATRELARLGKAAEPSLRRALEKKPNLEVRRRIDRLLAALSAGPTPEYLQALRAVEVLEKVGTPEARKVLRSLAGGAAEAEPTRQARAALDRLERAVKRP